MSLIDTRPGYFSPRMDLSGRQNPNKSLSGLLFHLLGEEASGQSFAKHLASLSPEQHQLLEAKTGGHLPQFRSLARETKSDVFARELLQLGLLLQGDGHGELAGRIYHSLGGGDEAFAEIGDEALREQARQCLEHLKRGSLGSGMGATFRSVVHGSTDLPAVLTMGALGPVFRLTRAVTFARLAGAETVTLFTQGVGLRAAAYLSGFMAESLVYTASSEIAGAVSGNALDSNLSFFGKWAGGAMMLGGLKAVPALLGLGASWAGSASLTGRIVQLAAPSVGQVSGMLLGNGLQAVAGLRELGSGAAEITDAVTGVLHCYVGGQIVGRRFGFMEAIEKGVELQVAQLEAFRLPKIFPSGALERNLGYAGAAHRISGRESPKSPQEPRGSGVLMSGLKQADSNAAGSDAVSSEGIAPKGAARRAPEKPHVKVGESRPCTSSEAPPSKLSLDKLPFSARQALVNFITVFKRSLKQGIRETLSRLNLEFDRLSYEERRAFVLSIGEHLESFLRAEDHGQGLVRRCFSEWSPRSLEDMGVRPQLAQGMAGYLAHEDAALRAVALNILTTAILEMKPEELLAFREMSEQLPLHDNSRALRIVMVAVAQGEAEQVGAYLTHEDASWPAAALIGLRKMIPEMDYEKLLAFERAFESLPLNEGIRALRVAIALERGRKSGQDEKSLAPPRDRVVPRPVSAASREPSIGDLEIARIVDEILGDAEGKGEEEREIMSRDALDERVYAAYYEGDKNPLLNLDSFKTKMYGISEVRRRVEGSPVIKKVGGRTTGEIKRIVAALTEVLSHVKPEEPISLTRLARSASQVNNADPNNPKLGGRVFENVVFGSRDRAPPAEVQDLLKANLHLITPQKKHD